MMGKGMEQMPLGNDTLEFNQEFTKQTLDSFKDRIEKIKDQIKENETLSYFSKETLDNQNKKIISLEKTLKYLFLVFNDIKRTKNIIENSNLENKLKTKKILDGKRKLKGLIKQFEYIGLSIYELEKQLGIEMKTDMDKVSKVDNNTKKNKVDILEEIKKLEKKRNIEKVDILDEIRRLREEKLNKENIRKEIEDAKQRDAYYRYLETEGKEPLLQRDRIRLSYWLIRNSKKDVTLNYNDKINIYISASNLNPKKYRDKVIKILIKKYGKKSWSKWHLQIINSLGKNNDEKDNIVKPLKKYYLKQCVKNELIDYDYSRTLEIIEELKKLGMIKEILKIENFLEKEKRFFELQEIQISRIYSDIFVKKSDGLVTSFNIKYDFYNTGELQECIVVFVDENHQKIFLDTDNGRKKAQEQEKQYKNSDFVKQREKEEKNSVRIIYI